MDEYNIIFWLRHFDIKKYLTHFNYYIKHLFLTMIQ